MIPRFGYPREHSRRYRLRPGAYAVLFDGKRVLLTHQSEPMDEFQLPGGGIDAGESPLRALHREVMEETGWHVASPRRLGAFRRFTFMPEYGFWAEKLCIVFLARPVRRVAPPSEAGHTAVWMTPGEAALRVGNDGDRWFLRLAAAARA